MQPEQPDSILNIEVTCCVWLEPGFPPVTNGCSLKIVFGVAVRKKTVHTENLC